MGILNLLITAFLLGSGAGTPAFDNPRVAWHYNTGAVIMCSPAVANIDNAYPGSEIVIGNTVGEVLCFSSDGALIWSQSFKEPLGFLHPAIADIDEDGIPEVLIHSRREDNQGCLFCLNNDGTERWRLNTQNYWRNVGLTIANIDTVGTPEILVGSSNGTVYCVNSSGVIKWTYSTGSFIDAPAVANIDEQGTPEVLFGSSDGKLYCLDSEGNLEWETWLDIPIHDNVIADIDLDGKPEIIVSARQLFDNSILYCVKSDGSIKWSKEIITYNASGLSMAAIDDINNDSYPEIVVFSNSYTDSKDSIFALQDAGDSARVVWVAGAADWIGGSSTIPVIYDLDGNGVKEVIWEGTEYLRIYDGSDGGVLYENTDLYSPTAHEHPAIADIDGDGHADIITIYRNSEIAVLKCDDWIECRDQFSCYTYHITNINDDLSVPRIEPNLWETHNSWLSQGFLPYGTIIVRPDQADSVLPDSTREYTLIVINRTDSSDVVNISSSGTIPEWRREIYDSTGTDTLLDTNGDEVPDIDSLFPDDTARILVKITPPPDALYGDTDTTTITGSLSHNPTVRDHAILITTVERMIGVNIEPSSSDSTQPGETVRYYLWVRNEGNFIDCIDINAMSSWDTKIFDCTGIDTLTDTDGDGVQDVGDVSPYESEGLFVDITPPQDVLLGEIDTALVYAISSIDTSVSDSVSLITRVYGDIGVIIEPDISDSTYPQEMIEYQLYITNVGKYEDVVDIETRHTEEWDFSLVDRQGNELCDTDGDGRIDVGSLETGETTVIKFEVTPPPSLRTGLEDTSVIYAISSLDTARMDSAAVTTRIRRIVDIDLETDVPSDSVAPLETTFYPFRVINLGNGDDTVDLSISNASQGWEYVIYEDDIPAEDHNNNTLPDVIVQMYGEEELRLKVIPPLTVAYTEDTVKLTGISSVDTSVRDSLLFITVVRASPSISIEPDMEGFVSTGETEEYALSVSCGNVGDTISLSPTPLPDGWKGALYYEGEEMDDINGDGLLDLGYLSSFEERNITFKVTAPELIGYTSDIDVASVVSAYSILYPPLSDSAVITTHLRIGLDIYNYESPFKEKTTFVFSLPHSGDIKLDIYNRAGEKIKRLINTRYYNRGIHTEPWDGTNDNGERASPGVYIYVFEVTKDDGGTDRLIKKTILQK